MLGIERFLLLLLGVLLGQHLVTDVTMGLCFDCFLDSEIVAGPCAAACSIPGRS